MNEVIGIVFLMLFGGFVLAVGYLYVGPRKHK